MADVKRLKLLNDEPELSGLVNRAMNRTPTIKADKIVNVMLVVTDDRANL